MTTDGGVTDPTEADRDEGGMDAPPGIVGDAEGYQTDDGQYVLTDGTNGGWIVMWDPADVVRNR